MLDAVDDDVLPFFAVHIYAVYGVVNHLRAGQLPKGSFDLDVLLWERWRTALAKQRSLVHLLNERWLKRGSRQVQLTTRRLDLSRLPEVWFQRYAT